MAGCPLTVQYGLIARINPPRLQGKHAGCLGERLLLLDRSPPIISVDGKAKPAPAKRIPMNMKVRTSLATFLMIVFGLTACVQNNNTSTSTTQPSPSQSSSPSTTPQTAQGPAPQSQVTLPVLDALLANDAFTSQLKTKLQITDDQINALKASAASEVNKLRTENAEENVAVSADGRTRTAAQLSQIIGEDKTKELIRLASDFWARGANPEDTAAQQESAKPNAVPSDTRIVVNIPAYRMDLFKDGSLVKSYKIGIGYPEFPLPQGQRKAQTIIFNPTWTPPDSPWVAKMKDITPGEKVEAGSKLNPLGPIKIPIGLPSLIHGGKSPSKLGTFASHGCVGLTTPQVKDFAVQLGQLSQTELTPEAMNARLKNPTQTQVLKLKNSVPVELRYETIVLEDGKLHIYKDVYDENSNTEETLRAVLEANGTRLEDLNEQQRAEILAALNQMSLHPKAMPSPSPSPSIEEKGRKQKQASKKTPKNQKEIVIDLGTSLAGKGYPAPANFDEGTGRNVR
jgi:lipoprotein-anchoring transpeptidase ErfK/SrfK